MRPLRITALLVALSGLFAPRSFADPMTFTFQGFGTGSIAGHSFTDAPFTITAAGDTINRESFDELFTLDHSSASISIAEVGTFTFLVPTRTFIRQFPLAHAGVVGFSRAGGEGLDLYDGPTSPLLATWNILSSIGPVSGRATLLQWGSEAPPVLTSGGVLTFTDSESTAIFDARIQTSPTPEPASLVLVGLGLGAARLARGRRPVHAT